LTGRRAGHGSRRAAGAPRGGGGGGGGGDGGERDASAEAALPGGVAGVAPRAKKSFGQHFLAEPRIARGIAELATTPPGGTVLEIGPGQGALTRHLLERAGCVVAVERDRELIPLLQQTFAAAIAEGRLVLREADAAQLDWAAELAGRQGPRVVAGNLPYNITGRLIQRAVEIADDIDGAVFMIQREVADRLAARPDAEAYGALSVFVQAAMSVERAFIVRPGAFRPPPSVDSAVVRLVPRRPPRARETEAFREVVKRAFATRRKTLRNAWKGLFGWSREELEAHAHEAGVSLDARGETLAVEDFARLAALAPAPRG
jgi:16S rRNA (adenine1518-N6/adenine1519-N6)-dimethyltransferase